MADEIKISGEPSTGGDRCKYTIDRPVLPGRSAHLTRPLEPGVSSFAEEVLAIPSIDSVLLAENAVTVSAAHEVDWPSLGLGNVIRKHLRAGEPFVVDRYFDALPSEGDLKWAIGDLFAREINPAIASHGGYVELIDVKKNNVYLRLGGGCQGCGAADVTLKQGIEKAIRELAPRVGEILDTTDHASGRNPYYSPAK